MRPMWVTLRGLGALVLMVLAGCRSTEPNLKPPPHPEEYNLPPEAEARYSKPVSFPEGTPRSGKKNQSTGMSPLSDPTRLRNPRYGGSGL